MKSREVIKIKKINHKDLEIVALEYGKAGLPMIVLGRTGIGKSYAIKEASKKVAKEKNKKFMEWNELTGEEKNMVLEEPNKHYLFVDLRLTQMVPEDIKGLPNFDTKRFVEWRVNKWTEALRVCEGTLFLDEINLAPPSLQACVYQVLLDKQVGETPLNKNVIIVGAGNLTEDRAGTFELAKPIRTRAGVYELVVPDVEGWTAYAVNKQIDSRVITFLNKFQGKIFVEDEKTDDVVSPRGWEFVSNLVKGETDLDKIQLSASGILGEGVGIEFVSFIKLMDKIPSPKDILSKKKKIPESIDLKYACIASITEYFRQQEKDRNEICKQFIDLKGDIDAEYYILGLRMFKGIQEDVLRKMIGTPQFKKIMEYKEYLAE